jgi:hypothetical protein
VLSRLVAEPSALSRVALAALKILHLDVPDPTRLREQDPEKLSDFADTRCVAACYRCILSYFNQPDHEIIDRRDVEARKILWRLACTDATLEEETLIATEIDADAKSEVKGWESAWRTALTAHAPELRAPILAEHGGSHLLHWPDYYAAVALPDTARALQAEWEDKGYTFVRFPEDQSVWPGAFGRLQRLVL